jgi:Domain of unknown function (DUF4272)
MTAMRYHVLRHIERVHHHLALEIEPPALSAFATWAANANAIVLLPEGPVCAPAGAVLVAPDTGDSAPGAAVPYLPDASRRKQATDGEIASREIHVPASLPPVVCEDEAELRPAFEIASRCLALFACALRAESLTSGKPIPVPEIEARLPQGFVFMSPREKIFMSTVSPARLESGVVFERHRALNWMTRFQDADWDDADTPT